MTYKTYDMSGRVALVTGAGSGIGRASAQLFAARGARVVVADLDEAGGRETVDLIASAGGTARFCRVDAASEAAVKAMIRFVLEAFGRLDFAHNHVGHPGPEGHITAVSLEDFERCHRLNTVSCFLGLKYEIPCMLKVGGGAIVNTGSLASLIGSPGLGAYVSAKHGVAGLTRTAALEFATRNIRVNAICPGATDTPMMRRAMDKLNIPANIMLQHWVEPIGRFGTPQEQAEGAVWLCSDAASFITGQAFPIDGGHMAGNRAPE